MAVRLRGVKGEIPALMNGISNPNLEAGLGTMLGRRFDWGGRLPKSNGGAQRYAQIGWKPIAECNCRSVLDCETYKSNRDESRE